ncbi:glycoside hydrolase N-terminal domain-containing protein [Oscillatoria laete-virens NRMC-F 0139]|nr:glycoside hydrolase N-terminal domain-containing protein [Oscillatoria laete-virens]MDL5054440.1 glycoside hydrolase N-terminal domain-containing protein [Oscillatoria laete-virens NRMC-F 0139]
MYKPAVDWREASPLGNGTVGASVYGAVSREKILFNHESHWYGAVTRPMPDFSDLMPVLRKLLSEKKYAQANDLYVEEYRKRGYNGISPGFIHPGFNLEFEQETQFAFAGYQRVLNMASGESLVTWRDGDIAFERRAFVSRSDEVFVMEIKASKKKSVTVEFWLDAHDLQRCVNVAGKSMAPPMSFETGFRSNDLSVLGTYQDGDKKGVHFGGLVRILPQGGEMSYLEETLKVEGANSILILVGQFADGKKEEGFARVKKQLDGVTGNYARLFKRHEKVHRSLFLSMELDLEVPRKERALTNEELLMRAYQGDYALALLEKQFDFGRYLQIASVNSESLPSHLQGIWNGDYDAPWGGWYVTNENIQMNYWQLLPGNLPGLMESYFRFFESRMDDFRTNARHLFGCRGIVIPLALSPESGLHKLHMPHVVYWTAGAGWIASLFYDYYLFTGDEDFLRTRATPFIRECAHFYEDFLITDPEGKWMVSPSNSPENCTPAHIRGYDQDGNETGYIAIALNATMDFAVAKEIFSNLLRIHEGKKGHEHECQKWRAILDRFPDYQINPDGALTEWIHPDFPDNYNHRHESHLYPAFPGFEVTQENNPRLFRAAQIALDKRMIVGLRQQTGWSLMHMANARARLGQGDLAYECLVIMSRACVGDNLYTYCNDWRNQGITRRDIWGKTAPFQVDASMGLTAAALEMLCFSVPGTIKILPALPKTIERGSVRGVLCRGGVTVSIKWNRKKQKLDVTLISKKAQQIRFIPPLWAGKSRNLKMKANQLIEISMRGK